MLVEHRGNSGRLIDRRQLPGALFLGLLDTPLDFAYIPSAMGQGPGLGLGLALAQPERGVVVLNGDGSMLMNLGSLVTLAAHPAPVQLSRR